MEFKKIAINPLSNVALIEESKILVVEDDEQLRKVTVQMLERRGYRVRSAADGEEAMAALESAKAAPPPEAPRESPCRRISSF